MTNEPHPDVQAVLETLDEQGIPEFSSLSVAGARKLSDDLKAEAAAASPDPEPVARVRDLLVPGPDEPVPIRVYEPEGDGPFPVVVWIHGGGWILGSVDTDDGRCRDLANATGSVVVSVEYRRSPEATFPEPVEDCYAAAAWVEENLGLFDGDPDRIAVAGASSGGNLAAAVALMARDRGAPSFAFQLLAIPVTDHAFDTDSYVENAEGYHLTRRDMQWYWEQYLEDDLDGKHPYASPLQARSLAGLPPATVMTAEFDPLRDDGVQYAERLEAAGVPVTHRHYEGMYHGFMTDAKPYAQEAAEDMATDLREVFGT